MNIENILKHLTPENLDKINKAFVDKRNKIPTYSFSKITFKTLEKLFEIKHNTKKNVFNTWFKNKISLSADDIQFLINLIKNHEVLIDSYKEEDLKVKFITPILNRIQFLDMDIPYRDFYEEQLTYKTEKFILTGVTDFLIAKGLEFPDEPYFFIQEFKKSIKNDDPRPQLLAELIAATELNQFNSMRGAYIVGAVWHFVILEKIETNKYQYFISKLFNATNIEDLKFIYQNLLFIKNEIIAISK